MGNCFKWCRGGDDSDISHSEIRHAAAEAVKRRNKEFDRRGMKGQGGFSSKKAKHDQKEDEMEARGGGPQGGELKWQVN